VVLETLMLSVLNHNCAVAAAAARMVTAAGDRPLVKMGGRRTHQDAAVAAVRAAYLAGFTATSNLAAGHRYGIPTAGTAAHAFTLLHGSEAEAFATQIEALGTDTTLLVDTYDITRGIATAIEVAGPQLRAIRIDSGNPGQLARQAREQLDRLGAPNVQIVVSGDLDEHSIAALRTEPVDSYGVGPSVVTGSAYRPPGWFTSWSRATVGRWPSTANRRPLGVAPKVPCAGTSPMAPRSRSWCSCAADRQSSGSTTGCSRCRCSGKGTLLARHPRCGRDANGSGLR
jgi:nicotinic acid phosphoribosyltransferase